MPYIAAVCTTLGYETPHMSDGVKGNSPRQWQIERNLSASAGEKANEQTKMQAHGNFLLASFSQTPPPTGW